MDAVELGPKVTVATPSICGLCGSDCERLYLVMFGNGEREREREREREISGWEKTRRDACGEANTCSDRWKP